MAGKPANPLRQAEFATAVQEGDLQRVRRLLKLGVDPNDKDIYTPLMLAGMYGHDEIFFELLNAGADVHARDKYGGSVLANLAAKGSLRAMQAVIDAGIDESDNLPQALLDACLSNSIDVVKALVKAGADVNHSDKACGTPLLAAVCRNRPEIVAELLQRGARTDALSPRGDEKKHFKKTALEIATLEGYSEIVTLLQEAGTKMPAKVSRPAESGSITDSWKLIKKWLKGNAAGWKALNKAATASQLGQAEIELGFKLPAELRESYALHNGGGQLFPNPDDIPFYLMPLEEVVHSWKMLKELADSGEFAGSKPTSAKGIRNDWWNAGWIPFAANGGGDFFCIDLAPAKGGAEGQVITHNHESGAHKLLARSLRAYLHDLAYDLRDGKYSFDEEDQSLS